MEKVREMKENAGRDFGADAVRIAAGIMVLILHFFLRNGFYYKEMTGFWGIAAITVRSITLCSVPLFVMLTGYLKCRKEWSVRFYRSIIPILVSYVLISLLHLPFKIFYLKEERSAAEWLLQFLGFHLAEYSWYVGMYIGLFLLIPLLNLIWAGCRTERAHMGVILSLAAVTFLPQTVNLFIEADTDLLPSYFTGMYYLTYYFLGCYVQTYKPRVPQGALWSIILITGIGIAVINVFTRSEAANFYSGFSAGYSHYFTALITLCLFLSLYRVRCRRQWIRRAAERLSGLVFEIYLCSFLIDRIVYVKFAGGYPVSCYFPVGFLMVSIVFLGSLFLAAGVKALSRKLFSMILRC